MSDVATIEIAAKEYADVDDCLSAAAEDIAKKRNLYKYQVGAKWKDHSREIIIIDICD